MVSAPPKTVVMKMDLASQDYEAKSSERDAGGAVLPDKFSENLQHRQPPDFLCQKIKAEPPLENVGKKRLTGSEKNNSVAALKSSKTSKT
jgi:hypothetical protein